MLKVKNLYTSYKVGREDCPILKGVSLEITAGEFVAVMGPSGSGKTTLLNCISAYLPFEEGEIAIGDINPAHLGEDELAELRNGKLGFVFQDFMLLDGLSVRENILLPRIIAGRADHNMESAAEHLCALFGIAHIKDKYPAQISGGERQRTAVARALINNPLLILADEPTGNLDSKSGAAVIGAFKQAQRSLDATIFMVTHDSFAAAHCDRVVLMRDGTVHSVLCSGGDTGAFHGELLAAIKALSEEVAG